VKFFFSLEAKSRKIAGGGTFEGAFFEKRADPVTFFGQKTRPKNSKK